MISVNFVLPLGGMKATAGLNTAPYLVEELAPV